MENEKNYGTNGKKTRTAEPFTELKKKTSKQLNKIPPEK
jgi:hypothetical protein